MANLFEHVNLVMSEWDPIGVGPHMATDEYRRYVPLVVKASEDETSLMKCLQDILVNRLSLEFDPENSAHLASMQDICRRIMELK